MTDSLIGSLADSTPLEMFGGGQASLEMFANQRTVVYCFSTWALGRAQLPLWQELSERLSTDARVIAVAAEVEGARWLEGYLRAAKIDFPVLIDRKNVVGGVYGFKTVPNVLMFDAGRLAGRWLWDASLRKRECRDEIEAFLLHGKRPDPKYVNPAHAPLPASQEAFAQAVDIFLTGDLDGCQIPWRKSIRLDPEHWISQEQLWVLRAPERFHPYIDIPWQNEQLAAEGRPVCACDLDE